MIGRMMSFDKNTSNLFVMYGAILASEALVIWMFRIAMNEPIMAASTATQTAALARLGSLAARSGVAARFRSSR